MKDDGLEEKAGYLVLRLKPGEGLIINGNIEVRLASVAKRDREEAQIAVRAPREYKIRRVK